MKQQSKSKKNHDLCINYEYHSIQETTLNDFQRDIKMKQMIIACLLDGYHAVAINVQAQNQVEQKHVDSIKSFKITAQMLKKQSSHFPLIKKIDFLNQSIQQFIQLSRVTVNLQSAKNISYLIVRAITCNGKIAIQRTNMKLINNFDLLALRPKAQKLFEIACNQCQCDIITLDFSQKLPFFLKKTLIQTAMDRGIYFQVVYSDSILDHNSRRYFIQNLSNLIDLTKGGKGVIISSGASQSLLHRSPNDLRAIGNLVGMKPQIALQTFTTNCDMVIKHSKMRRSYKGVVSLISQQQYATDKARFSTSIKYEENSKDTIMQQEKEHS